MEWDSEEIGRVLKLMKVFWMFFWCSCSLFYEKKKKVRTLCFADFSIELVKLYMYISFKQRQYQIIKVGKLDILVFS